MRQTQLACMLLLCFTCGGLCTDARQDQQALEEDLLNSVLTAKNKQSAPFWRLSMASLCRMWTSQHQDAWRGEEEEQKEEEEEEEEHGLREGSLEQLEKVYNMQNLQHICRALQSREERLLHDSVEYLEENSERPLKRKSPYILKRQVGRSSKSRRPYILKRSAVY